MGKIWYLNRTTMTAESVLSKIGLLRSFALPHPHGVAQKTHTSQRHLLGILHTCKFICL